MKYGLTWDQEKNPETIVTQTDAGVPFIEEIKELTVKGQDTQHILIDSDNYPALKILNQTHRNAVDIICIDPPYNTGNEFIYNDKRVDEEDDYRHSKWLNFMDKRIKLSYNLLKDDGIFYCFIGHDELANLILMLDQTFGRQNRLTIIARVVKVGGGQSKDFVSNCDYILVYGKNKNLLNIGITRDEPKHEERTITLPKNKWGTPDESKDYSHKQYPVECPDGSFVTPAKDDLWGFSLNRFNKEKELGNILIKKSDKSGLIDKDGNKAIWIVSHKRILDGLMKAPNYIHNSKYFSSAGSKELKELFGGNKVFDYPKPTALIEYLINITNKEKNITVLDFFAGSGTTAHAVMNLNEKDLGSRQSISIALNDIDDEADICTDVTYERLKIVVKNIQDKYQGQLDLTAAGNPTLKYLKVQILDYQSETQSILIEKNNKETLCQ